MYKWNNIVVVGDSFCYARKTQDHWPYRLTSLLTGEEPIRPVYGVGIAGTSWWSVKRRLSRCINSDTKVLIVCHTEPMRLPNDHDYPMSVTNAYQNNPGEEWEAARLYYKHLFSEDFHLWCQTQWFKELDDIVEKTPSIEQVYHLQCFYGPWNKHRFKKGVMFDDNLFNYYHHDTDDVTYHNHLTVKDNRRLAEQLAELIKVYRGDGFVVKKFNLEDIKDD